MSLLCTIGILCLCCNAVFIVALLAVGFHYRRQIETAARLAMSMYGARAPTATAPSRQTEAESDEDEGLPPAPMDNKKNL